MKISTIFKNFKNKFIINISNLGATYPITKFG